VVPDQAAQVADRYDRRTIVLHWMTASLVLLLWGIAQIIDDFAKGSPRITVRSVHISLGVILLLLVGARIYWRARFGTRLPNARQGWMGQVAKLSHYLLYGLLAGVLLMGVTNVWVRGDSYFGLFKVPAWDPGNERLRDTVGDLHETLANALLIVAGLHALAALGHHFILRDSVMRRMVSRGCGKRSAGQ